MKPLALTMGDPAGIGGELTLRAWLELRNTGRCFVALDDPARLAALAHAVGLDVSIREVQQPDLAESVFADALPVLPVRLATPPRAGVPDSANAAAIIGSIERATKLAIAGSVGGVVTNPINKAALYAAGFAYPGHTEFLAALTGAVGQQVMMLASPGLRVVPVTVHASLRDSIAMLTTELILGTARTTAAALRRDFGIMQPRLAVAGLNPHAGESGALGDEETTIIGPAIHALRADDEDVTGPWPPDTMFTTTARKRFDVAICMYHDQGLIPLKTLDMDHGVNVTLGLPIVRTSPDHGTAFDIAGKGVADPSSLIAALGLAAGIAARRQ
ncbi:MAG TPA: 4-hydroxythreonine-4-phosphate dehydrogenase PdxA [Acetobacteraceae bacterium]|nr:4-hydroxythreonine-4-phosphate dehydrogenase PdxA [Acetobacteraceae bacterium]